MSYVDPRVRTQNILAFRLRESSRGWGPAKGGSINQYNPLLRDTNPGALTQPKRQNLLSAHPEVPSDLLILQRWFSSAITRPIDSDSQKDADQFIAPSLRLSPEQRIQIYNQQYWWRLLNLLHENFPTLTRLFGYFHFNQSLGIPFLTQCPPQHWSLTKLGDQMAPWINEHYEAKDKPLVLCAAEVDWAYQELFFACAPLPLDSSADLLSKKMRLQQHVKLFKLPFDFFSFRSAFLKEPVEFWQAADFPPLPKERNYFFVLYRTEENILCYQEMQEAEWTLLQSIADGQTIEEACDQLEKTGGDLYHQAQSSIVKWAHRWMKEKWLL